MILVARILGGRASARLRLSGRRFAVPTLPHLASARLGRTLDHLGRLGSPGAAPRGLHLPDGWAPAPPDMTDSKSDSIS